MNLFCFGIGYSASTLLRLHGHRFASISGTVRSEEKARSLRSQGINALVFNGRGASPELAAAFAQCDVLLVSAAPDEKGDPVLAALPSLLSKARNLRCILYWSTVGVYGDHGGQWIDETAGLNAVSARGTRRIDAESAWQNVSANLGIPLLIHRLAGIYGPGRSVLDDLASGTARRIIKPGQVFNRIHVDDIAGSAIAGLSMAGASGAFNICDDEPCPPQNVVTFAARLMGLPLPPAISIDEARLSEMGRSFYSESKRCRNLRLKSVLRYQLLHPSYREGLTSLHAERKKIA
jgi:nucleoside-diphosphate-sugar epimerase